MATENPTNSYIKKPENPTPQFKVIDLFKSSFRMVIDHFSHFRVLLVLMTLSVFVLAYIPGLFAREAAVGLEEGNWASALVGVGLISIVFSLISSFFSFIFSMTSMKLASDILYKRSSNFAVSIKLVFSQIMSLIGLSIRAAWFAGKWMIPLMVVMIIQTVMMGAMFSGGGLFSSVLGVTRGGAIVEEIVEEEVVEEELEEVLAELAEIEGSSVDIVEPEEDVEFDLSEWGDSVGYEDVDNFGVESSDMKSFGVMGFGLMLLAFVAGIFGFIFSARDSVYASFAFQVYWNENLKGAAALKRSVAMAKGSFWKLALSYFCFGLLMIAIMIPLNVVLGFLGSGVIGQVVSVFVSSLFTIVSVCFSVLVYGVFQAFAAGGKGEVQMGPTVAANIAMGTATDVPVQPTPAAPTVPPTTPPVPPAPPVPPTTPPVPPTTPPTAS